MATSAERTHYQVLGVAPGASPTQIRDAHRQLARVLHPDRLSEANDAERRLAERRMREVNVAWTALSDPTRRADYDRSLRARATGPGGGATYGSGASGPGSARSYGAPVDPASGPAGADASLADDPDEFFRRLREAERDPDEPQLSSWHFWILRRGPIVAAVVVALFLFVMTAYAGSGNDGASDDPATPTTVGSRDCVRLTEGRTAVQVSCSADNDGHIVTEVGAALDCPTKTNYVLIESRFICISNDPSVVGSTPPDLED